MALPRDSAAAVEPVLAEVVREPAIAAHGSEQIARILTAAEEEIASIAERADREARGMRAGAENRVRQLNAERLQAISRLKSDLTERASALAVRFEAMFDQLDAAERELIAATRLEPPAGTTVTLTERRRVTVAHDVETVPEIAPKHVITPVEPPEKRPKRGTRKAQLEDSVEQADGPRRVDAGPDGRKKRPRRRWWRRRLRPAA